MTPALSERHCVSCRGGLPRLDESALAAGLSELPAWTLADCASRLRRNFRFRDFVEAMRFVNSCDRELYPVILLL